MKPALPDMNHKALDARLESIGSRIVLERRTPHEVSALVVAIKEALAAGADPLLIFGASAITDRRDVIPAAIVEAGGRIDHFGMPVDPGNLLLLGRIDDRLVIGLPGCARSPKLNGIDFVLWRVAAGLPIGGREIATMGVGGLLTEIPTRPQPRDERPNDVPRLPTIGAVVLAAGKSSRMGSNKLLIDVGGKPLVRRAVEGAVKSAAHPGNVVLWARRFFPEMLTLEGDTGAKHLMAQYEELVCEVEAPDDGPLIDIDTPEALAAYRAR